MSIFDHVVPSSPQRTGRFKYSVNDLYDPIPFGKFKGESLSELDNSARGWLAWAAKEELFGPESFWNEETMNHYAKCLEEPPRKQASYGDDGILFEVDQYDEEW